LETVGDGIRGGGFKRIQGIPGGLPEGCLGGRVTEWVPGCARTRKPKDVKPGS